VRPLKTWEIICLVIAGFLLFNGKLPGFISPSKATAAVYVYEKNTGGVPPVVQSAIGKLNERENFIATTHEDDATNAQGVIPAQYKNAVPAARAAGLPALVVSAGEKVLRTVTKPTTAAQVIDAVP
jgi:hypothetical protein